MDQLAKRCETLQQQVWQTSQLVGEDTGQLRMAVLEPAVVADVPSEPQKGRIMAMAVILGLLLGGGAAVGREWRDQTLRSTDEISAILGVPVLGAVPAMSRRQRMSERGRKVLLQPDSREAEAFRTIRTAVLFGASDSVKTILITSPIAGEGKSTLVSNLAIAMACAGQKTLVLDADFRKPTQHLIFRLNPRERCLRDVFAGTLALGAAVQPTGIETLQVLTCGYQIANPAEVLHSQQFAHLLTCLTEVYDRIVIDAPPVTVVTDAQILGALCDATVLVLKADRSVRKVAQHAIDALQSVGAHLLGVVVNEVYKHGTRYGYYYDRYRKYYNTRDRGANGKARTGITVVPDPTVLPAKTTSEAV
jgi:succinoglycan biosynthesis transport protein ExoP